MIEKPTITEDNLRHFWNLAFPYLIQRIKMWNGGVVTAQKLSGLLQRQGIALKEKTDTANLSQEPGSNHFAVSKLDFLTILLNVGETIVVEDILRIMSKFPMTVPLIIQDMEENGKYLVTIPSIQNIVIKWESNHGQIVENYLFTSSFKMVVALRIGKNTIGKSTILNQLMRKQYMFSSIGEPGGKYGPPLTLNGSVEMLWMTQETCSDITWETSLCGFYERGTDEVALLTNLHGDALQHPDIVKYLATYACSFIVFVMPDATEPQRIQLQELISTKRRPNAFVFVDPTEEKSDMIVIETNRLSNDETQETMRNLLLESVSKNAISNPGLDSESISQPAGEGLRFSKAFGCEVSDKLIQIVKQNGVACIKQLIENFDSQSHCSKDTVENLVHLSAKIYNLDSTLARKSLTYLETQLFQLSAKEYLKAQVAVSEAKEQLRRIVKYPPKSTKGGKVQESQKEIHLIKAQRELRDALEKLDNVHFGQEHIFRLLGHIYEKSMTITDLRDNPDISNLPSHLADLLIGGHAIEMVNGDLGKVQLTWFKAICELVSKKLPNLRVFVISIIGLQSSGKSTLLNALFSCKFAVSVGRCTRGLFMRMVFLADDHRESHGYDCIILIDTEGLCSPEKMNDPDAKQKDRLMATLAMGISNLTMVNILGENFREMTEILQIAIVAMARLRSGGYKPDILMVQHLQERNIARIDQAKGQFCESINKAFELINRNDIEIGSTSEECLTELTARIHSGDLFQHFGAFQDGARANSPPSENYHKDVVDLYQTLLERGRKCDYINTFERWSEIFDGFWSCVREENFALNFTNVKHITDFLFFEKKIAKVKELNDRAVRRHQEIFSKKIVEKIGWIIKRKGDSEHVQSDNLRRQILENDESQLRKIPHECSPLVPNPLHRKPQPDITRCECSDFRTEYSRLIAEIKDNDDKQKTIRSLKDFSDSLRRRTMKALELKFDGSVIKQGCFSAFADVITKELKTALKERPSGKYSDTEQKQIAQKIWKELKNTAANRSNEPPSDLHTRIKQALNEEYVKSGVMPNMINDFEKERTFSELLSKKAIKELNTSDECDLLDKKHLQILVVEISSVVTNVLRTRGDNINKTGLNFEDGMIREIRDKFPEAIRSHEEKFGQPLQDAFKMHLLMYTMQHLEKEMAKLQNIWDRQNTPSKILEGKKPDYMKQIEIRLKSEFSCSGEGEIVATKLFEAMKQNAIESAYRVKVQLARDAPWTANSEKVRLRYFEKLAEEVAMGKKERVLSHFKNPKTSITDWFKVELESLITKDALMEKYMSALETSFSATKKEVSCCSDKKAIYRVVSQRIGCDDDQYYSEIDPKDYEFETYRSSIVHTLQILQEKAGVGVVGRRISLSINKANIVDVIQERLPTFYKTEYRTLDSEFKKQCDIEALKRIALENLEQFYQSANADNVTFPLLCDNPEIKRRLGCTENCHWCGSLCWGAFDHVDSGSAKNRDTGISISSPHHACHQPRGLTGTTYTHTGKLLSEACHAVGDSVHVRFGNVYRYGMLWSEAKKNHFQDWNFDVHRVTKFDELMRWFFQELHEDIAQQGGFHPADGEDLKKHGCCDLNLDDILKVVRSKVYVS